MQIKIELSESDVREALICYVGSRVKIEGYLPSEVDFIYDESDEDYHSSLEGAFVTLESKVTQLVLPSRAEAA